MMINESTLFLESVLSKTIQYDNSNDFILAVILDGEGLLRKELRVDDFSNHDDLRQHLVDTFNVLEKIWKLGMIYHHPEISNNEIKKYYTDNEILLNHVFDVLTAG